MPIGTHGQERVNKTAINYYTPYNDMFAHRNHYIKSLLTILLLTIQILTVLIKVVTQEKERMFNLDIIN